MKLQMEALHQGRGQLGNHTQHLNIIICHPTLAPSSIDPTPANRAMMMTLSTFNSLNLKNSTSAKSKWAMIIQRINSAATSTTSRESTWPLPQQPRVHHKENQRAPSSWWGKEIAELAIKDLKRTGQLVRGDGYLAKFSPNTWCTWREQLKSMIPFDAIPSLDKIESLANMSQIQALIPQAEAILPQTEAILPQAEAMLPPIEAVAHHLPTLRSSLHVLEAVGRMGSYGYLLGNEGSAYYVGHQTIKDLLAFVDRHQEPRKASNKIRSEEDDLQEAAIERSSLMGLVRAHFQIDRSANLMAAVYSIPSEHERKLKIAELSRLVMRAAFGAQQDTFAHNPRARRRSTEQTGEQGEQKEDVQILIITNLQNGSAKTRQRSAVSCLKVNFPPRFHESSLQLFTAPIDTRMTAIYCPKLSKSWKEQLQLAGEKEKMRMIRNEHKDGRNAKSVLDNHGIKPDSIIQRPF
ncbi:hypothetical protein PCASD_21866 [Puccinia coronata f. sp. avenae]|uniref:Uncharacterized protein n=1 Tax=Puccinia coronata f. sp. avenae TaxID=200324 RepID=A0A2N5TKY8_9BASI|nr:hypothetical protein PCASD_21866 [Puccinia coronata f. sp. avenae]